jgi:hypothetical protein
MGVCIFFQRHGVSFEDSLRRALPNVRAPSTYLLDFVKLDFIKVERWVICAGDDVCSNPGTGTRKLG